MQMKMIACHPRLILQKKMQLLDVIFLCYHKKTVFYLKEGEKNVLCATFLARVQLYNHAPEAFLKELCFQFHSCSMGTMPSRSSLVQALVHILWKLLGTFVCQD